MNYHHANRLPLPLFSLLAGLSLTLGACGDDKQPRGPSTDSASSAGGHGGTDATNSGEAASTSGNIAGAAGAPATEAVTLNQSGNPIAGMLSQHVEWSSGSPDPATRLAEDEALADNMISWQMPHGGFFKNDVSVYTQPWNGEEPRSGWTGEDAVELGTIDNNATTTEIMFLADVYGRSGNTKYRDSARAAFDFLLGAQYPSGGFPQVYPARTGTTYSNLVTFNDNAMVRTLLLFRLAVGLVKPLNGDLFTTDQLERAEQAIAAGVDYILEAQLVQDGVKTVWCAQHDPVSYEPRAARSYELPSKSGKESAGIVGFLMTQPQTEPVASAVHAALAWFDSEAVRVDDTAYVGRPSSSTDDTYNPIQPRAGSTMWYRFYDLDQDVGFFSGRLPTDDPPGVGKKYDIMEIEPERRYGYQWGGSYGTALLSYARSVGY